MSTNKPKFDEYYNQDQPEEFAEDDDYTEDDDYSPYEKESLNFEKDARWEVEENETLKEKSFIYSLKYSEQGNSRNGNFRKIAKRENIRKV